MNIKTLGIDLAKKSFQLHGVDENGRTVFRKKVSRKELAEFVANLPLCCIAMESCATSHYWGRKFEKMGHEVRLIAAQFVKPFLINQKNDRNDAEAIVEACLRPRMRFVAVKKTWQQDIQCLHRARQRAVRARTVLINQTKGLFLEYGIVLDEKSDKFRNQALAIIEDADNELTPALRLLLRENINEYDFVLKQSKLLEKEIKEIASQSEDCKRLQEVPGVGLLGATAFVIF